MRLALVILTAVIAYTVPNFGYIVSFVGALGSTTLAYTLPCLFHTILFYTTLPRWVIIKNICIMVLLPKSSHVFRGSRCMAEAIHATHTHTYCITHHPVFCLDCPDHEKVFGLTAMVVGTVMSVIDIIKVF